ncbi:hypothetical protein [Micromonospora sp. WMMD987]|jgi:hypothetical protein|uniref:hypothetical protein n=1 Tax=Micromonospora TaxID=1873 RepID=UPI00249BD54A|nr:hypothetical protein [Micromonospora sp. WMMD987]WFE95054.1 hypothetical protein O7612_27695 [Micromonospora sp. WMMD987]
MRGGLDETLARLARREEARRRRTVDQGAEVDDGTPTVAFEATGPAAPAPGGSVAVPADVDPVEAVAEAVRRVVAGWPGLSVGLRVEYAGRTYPLRVERADTTAGRTGAAVRAAPEPPAAPPPAWPPASRTPPAWTPAREMPGVDPAARLAELIRRDPTLLDNND